MRGSKGRERLVSLSPRGEGWGEGDYQQSIEPRRVPLIRRFAPPSPRGEKEGLKHLKVLLEPLIRFSPVAYRVQVCVLHNGRTTQPLSLAELPLIVM